MHLNNNYSIFKMEGPMGVFLLLLVVSCYSFCLFVCCCFFFVLFVVFFGGGDGFGFVYIHKKDHFTILLLFRRPFSGTLATVKDNKIPELLYILVIDV